MVVSDCLSICRYGFVGAGLGTTATIQSYVVHQQPALCIMDHKGDLTFRRRSHPQIFHFSVKPFHLDFWNDLFAQELVLEFVCKVSLTITM